MGLEFDGVNGIIKNTTSDGDVTIKGNDGGSEISLLAFDVSAEGVATFNSKVGIKDSAPDVLLHVTQGGEPPAEGMFILEANSASRQLRIQPPTDADNGFIDYKGGNLTFLDDGTEVARFQGTTGFGIGTSTVNSKLEVAGNATITTADNTDTLTLISTDADASVGPNLRLYRNSSSPADNDDLGTIDFEGRNDNSQDVQYGMIRAILEDASDGTEDGTLEFHHMKNGSLSPSLQITPDECVINESSNDYDFRVESNGNANMLFVDGGNNRVGVGCDPSADFHVDSSGGGVIRVSRNSASTSNYMAIESDGTNGTVKAVQSLIFSTGGSETMRLDSSGNLFVDKTSSDYGTVGHELLVGGLAAHSRNQNPTLLLNRNTSEGTIQLFRYNNSDVGSISVTSSSTAFNTSSDYRLKENVSYDFDATTRLKQLKPSRFNFINTPDTTVDGFLAHEVSSIVPEAISGTKDATETKEKVVVNSSDVVIAEGIEEADWTKGKENEKYPTDSTWEASKTVPVYQAIDQSKLVPLLVKTIQELEARITALEG
jgi:prepilin-type processing-associated H-X9-DG protein